MAGTNNHGALMEDWMLPTPSPRTLMSSFLNEEFSSGPLSDIFGDNGSNKPRDGIEKSKAFVDSSREESAQVTKAPFQFESNLFGANQKSGSHGGLAERMAARTGFAVLKIDTSRVSSSAPIRSPVAIPPGVGPRELLESPVFLPNAIAQASPTTGKLPFFMPPNVNSTILSVPEKAEDRLRDDCVFSFQPVLRSEAPNFSIADKGFSVHQNQSSANNNQQELSLQSSSTATNDVTEATIVKPKTSDPMLENDHPSPADEREESEANQNGEYTSAPIIAPAEDGYNWRKYGQKQVKNSEHPRSYYKCTHPNCCVKKKVERSQDGHITEIVYRGSHSHPLPLPNCRPSVPFSHFNDLQADGSEKFGPMPVLNTETSRENAPNGHFQDVHGGVTETKLYASLNTAELADTSAMEPREAVDVSSTLSNEDDRATHGTISLGCEGNEDETESKRRKMDISAATTTTTSTIDMGALASRAVREPRVVVQTTSEVDILDDGYRWRKYGQKVVKGNPNPRSYYKCTHPGCSVRKHVERASHDLKSVITTYEGKHNHEVPAARNSGRPSSGSGIVTLAAQQANGHHRRPEPAQGSLAQFGSAAAYGSIGTLPRDQIVAAAGGFSFRMLPHGMAVPVPSLVTVMPAQMAGHTSASQSTELVPEESDHGTTQLLSVSAQIGTSDTSAQVGGTINVASVFPPMSSNDLPVGEPMTATKDLGSTVPLSPTTAVDRMGSVFAEPLNTGDALDIYQQVSHKLEALIAKDGKDVEIQSVIAEVPDILLRCVSRDEAALAVAQKVFRSLYENASKSTSVTWLLATLVAIRDVCKLVVKELTSWVIYSDEEKKFNIDIIIGLICSELLNLGDYNVHLAKIIDGGRNKAATEFAISLVQTMIAQESSSVSELYNVVDALSKLAIRPGSPESLQQLIDIARSNFNNTASFAAMKDEKVLSGRPLMNKEENNANDIALADTVGFQDQVAVLFSEWCHICDHPTMGDSAYSHHIVQLQQNGLLKGDDLTDRFFHILIELAVTHSVVSEQVIAPGVISQQPTQQLQISYFSIDSYSKLVALVVKYSSVDLGPNKGGLLPKILSVTARIIQKDVEEKKVSFNPRPYFRLFLNLLSELTTSDLQHDGANFQVLTAFANAFHVLQPMRVPAWSFAWLELVSHRSFMPKLLMCNSQKGWPFFQRLLVDLFKFMEPYLRNAELGQPIHLLYKGTLRVLLVLLHDFPEFLCDYHFSFCDVIPPSCIQMRNVILSAFPRNMRLPDPSTPNLKIDLLAEISIAPRIMSDVDGVLKAKQMKTQVDEYLKRPEGSSFLTDLKHKLLLPQNEANVAGTRYNVPLVNSLVLYVGMQAVQQLQHNKASASASAQQMNQSPSLDIFQIETATEVFRNLIMNMDTEGRYLLLNAIANQLRYPNNHTHYFSFIILYLFAEATQEIVQEQITRVLLERLVVNRPHPWGLLITFIELIKNPRYSFWARSFTRCAPEIEKLFESVARSCGGKAADDGVGLPDGGH